MIRFLYTVLFITLGGTIALGEEEVKEIRLWTSNSTVGIGGVSLRVPYLSPYSYKGWEGKIEHQKYRDLEGHFEGFRISSTIHLKGGLSFHPAKSSAMLHLNGDVLLGLQRYWMPLDNLLILGGGGWHVGAGGKYLPRNINNPFSLDFYSGGSGLLDVTYQCQIWGIPLSLGYGMRVPLLGVMFVPNKGATYYEIFALKNYANTIHISSLHNRQGIAQQFNIDMHLNPMTIRMGLGQDFLRYQANGMVFERKSLTVYIGTSLKLYRFWRRKSQQGHFNIVPTIGEGLGEEKIIDKE